MVPESSVTFPNFPWEQVSLVIEYETIKNAIFSNELPNQLKEYIILQTVKETTVNNIDEGTCTCTCVYETLNTCTCI